MPLEVLVTFVECILFIPVIIAIKEKDYWYGNPALGYLSIFLVITFIQLLIVLPHDLLGYLGKNTPNTVFYYNWHYILTGYIKLMVYYYLLNYRFKKLLITSFAIIITVFMAFELGTDSLTYYNTVLFVTKLYLTVNVFVIILSLMYAYQLLQDLSVENITQHPFFWLNAGFLTYHIGSISVYAFVGNGATNQEGEIAWIVNCIVLSLLYISIAMSFFYSKNLPKKS